jgi:5-methyltetrahydrofolate--homocysteine methyltransferase
MSDYSNLIQAILEGNDVRCVELTNEVLDEGASPQDIVSSGLQAGMLIVGDKFSAGDFFIPDMLLAARAVTRAMEAIRPHLSDSEMPTLGRVVIGTVSGDIHDIGKNVVAMFLRGVGFEVFDLGTGVPVARFVTAVKEHDPDIVGMSALVTTTMSDMQHVIAALESATLLSQVKVIVGGAPVTQRFADRIGADGYAPDGGAAISLCRKLLEE